jgi:penicillin-insensitive murein endopeptidase
MPHPSLQLPFALILLVSTVPALAQNPWAEVELPSSGRTQSIGSYAAGCVAGAVDLPLVGDGYQAMRPSRNRSWGHPRLVAYVQQMGRAAKARGLGGLLIGDLGQPRGGPASFGHASHQSGLDVDVWFRLRPQGAARLSRDQAEQMPMDSVVVASEGALDGKRWDPRYARLLELAAGHPDVDRIFVNPVIKQAICRSGPRGDWLAKLRPWWGHDAHFHVCLACPPDSPQCEPQKPIPSGDGCDEDLDGWVKELRLAAKRPKPAPRERTVPEMPLSCQAVLTADAVRASGRAVAGNDPAPATKHRLAGEDMADVLDRN